MIAGHYSACVAAGRAPGHGELELLASPLKLASPLVLGSARVLDSVPLLGRDDAETPAGALHLAQPGTLRRSLGADGTSLAAGEAAWKRWDRSLESYRRTDAVSAI